jgi:uncharacterized protein
MTNFTPAASLIGGGMIGLSAVMMMLFLGRIAGISGIVSGLLPPYQGAIQDRAMSIRVTFIFGLITAPMLVRLVTSTPIPQTVSNNVPLLAVAGLLVGFGSVYGAGCTSGHGVCGLARFSVRSLAATLTFMAVAAITVFVARHLIGA